MGMTSIVADRILKQINSNGDERIDHDEFVGFFLRLIMGSMEQRFSIAYKCFDVDNDQIITKQEVKVVLKNIPMTTIPRLKSSERLKPVRNQLGLNRVQHQLLRLEDFDQITKLTDLLFEHHSQGMYFDEFCKLCTEVTCELYMCIFDQIYQHVPCVKNFFTMRAHLPNFIRTTGHTMPPPRLISFEPPVTSKLVDRATQFEFIQSEYAQTYINSLKPRLAVHYADPPSDSTPIKNNQIIQDT